MTANLSSFHQNYNQDKKSTDIVEKDVRKWVESVVEFKANLDKQKNDAPLEKHLKRIKKFKVKKKPSLITTQTSNVRNGISGQRKSFKAKKPAKKSVQGHTEKLKKKETTQPPDVFEELKESYRNIKLPQNWTSGVSNGRVVFNRIKITLQNTQQKISVERSLVITKDLNVHVLVNGSEITLNNWEMQKIEKLDDIKRAIREIDSLKICDGMHNGLRSPQCSVVADNKQKAYQVTKSETAEPQKALAKKNKTKKSGGGKVVKQKSFQK